MSSFRTSVLETAAQHLVPHIPFAYPEDTVGATLSSLPGNRYDSVEAVYILDRQGHLCGIVRLLELLQLPRERTLGEVMTTQVPTAHPNDDQEKVAGLAVLQNLTDVPVVDNQGRLIGAVPAQALMTILRQEHIEDLHRLVGIQQQSSEAYHALEASPIRRAGDRLPWLLVGLVGSMLATFVVSRFETTLNALVAVSFFIPGIVYLADAIGTQTEAIVVRGLSLRNGSLESLLNGELWTGLLIGLCLGGVSLPLVWTGFGNFRLATAVALTIVMAGGVATTIGMLFPWLLNQLGKDPALGSGPVATIIQDVLSLLIYFITVQLLVI